MHSSHRLPTHTHAIPAPSHPLCLPASLPKQVDPDVQERVLAKYAEHVKELKHSARHG